MRIFKRLVSALLVGVLCAGLCGADSHAEVKTVRSLKALEPTVVHITDPASIKEYLESQGEEYDEDLVEIIQYTYPELENGKGKIGTPDSPNEWGGYEFYTKNLSTYTTTDFSCLLKEYNRPAGKVSINESVSISNKFTASAGIKAKYVEAALSVTVEQTNTFSVSWENTYNYPVSIKVYPRYEVKTGELWEEDQWYDDYYGTFTFYRAVGDDVRVYRR